MSRTFHSHFADDIREMVAYKTALGHKAASYEWNLQNLDRYCMKHYPDAVTLTKEIVFGWCQAAKGTGKSSYRANTIRNFGKYLTAIGKEAYVLPTEMFVSQKADLPYLFTDEELEHFFDATDHYPHRGNSPLLEYIIPVIFRLQYVCGLRPQEVRLLKRADFNFGKGTIYISESKWCKDRCLPVNPEIVTLCKGYDAIAQKICPGRIYFFSSKNGSAYTHGWLTAAFHKCWELSGNKETSKACVPYDLRHNFATRTLLRWAREGKDFEAYLPYLSTYMGHASFHSSYYYVHLLPEKLAVMDFMDNTGIIPEVPNEE